MFVTYSIKSALLGLLLILLQSPLLAQNKPKISDIAQSLEKLEAALFDETSMTMVYQRYHCDNLAPSGGELTYERKIVSDGNNLSIIHRFLEPKKLKNVVVPSKPRLIVVNDKCVFEWDSEHTATIHEFEYGQNIFQNLTYTSNLSLNQPKRIAKSRGVSISAVRKNNKGYSDLPYLPDFLIENSAQYSVRDKPEMLGDRLTWVVEWPGMDSFNVDPSRGYAILRRKYHWGPDKPQRVEFVYSDLREIKPGVWIPFEQIERKYGHIADNKQYYDKIIAVCKYKLQSLTFEKPEQVVFALNLPSGTRVMDCVREIDYIIPENYSGDPFSAIKVDPKSYTVKLLLYILVPVAVVLVFLALFRRLKKARLSAGLADK